MLPCCYERLLVYQASRLCPKYDGPIWLNAILFCSFPSQVHQEVVGMFQYGVLPCLIEESHDVGIVVPCYDSCCRHSLWKRSLGQTVSPFSQVPIPLPVKPCTKTVSTRIGGLPSYSISMLSSLSIRLLGFADAMVDPGREVEVPQSIPVLLAQRFSR